VVNPPAHKVFECWFRFTGYRAAKQQDSDLAPGIFNRQDAKGAKNPKPFTLNLIPTGRALLPQCPIIFSFGVQCSMFRLLAP